MTRNGSEWQKECYWLVFTRVDWTDGINHEGVGKLWKAYANSAHLFASQSKSIFINMFPSHDFLIPSHSPSCYIYVYIQCIYIYLSSEPSERNGWRQSCWLLRFQPDTQRATHQRHVTYQRPNLWKDVAFWRRKQLDHTASS